MYTGFYGSARMNLYPLSHLGRRVWHRSLTCAHNKHSISTEKDADERGFPSMSGIILTLRSNPDEL